MGTSYLTPSASFLFIVFQILLCYDMAIADPLFSTRSRHCATSGGSNLPTIEYKERCYMMTTDELAHQLERIHVLADLLLDLLIGNPRAQVLTEIIIEASVLPEH